MRKATLLILILLVASFGVLFAEEEAELVPPTAEEAAEAIQTLADVETRLAGANFTPSISGSASVTWGIDLDTMANGFANATSSSLSFTIVPSASAEKGGEGDVYGWISLGSFSVSGVTITAPTVDAKLVLGPVNIDIIGADDLVNKFGAMPSVVSTTIMGAADAVETNYSEEFKGIEVEFATDAFSAGLSYTSEYDWVDSGSTDANTAGAYRFGLTGSLSAVENLGLSFAANLGYNYAANPIGFGVAVDYTVAMGDMALVPSVAFDGQSNAGGFDMEVGGGVKFTFPGSALDTANFDASPGVSLGAAFEMVGGGSDMEMKVGVYDAVDGFVAPIGIGLDLEIVSMLTALDMGLAAYATADFGVVDPYVGAYIKNLLTTGATTLELEAGVALSVIDNTTFTLAWDSGELLIAESLGIVTFKTTIAY